jgi:hypothetical protein
MCHITILSVADIIKHWWQINEIVRSNAGIIPMMENHSTWRITCCSVSWSTTHPIWFGLGLNTGLCSQKPATNHLSHSMALFIKLGITICIMPKRDKPQNKSLSHFIILLATEQLESL